MIVAQIKKQMELLVERFKQKHLDLGMKASGKWIDSLEVEVIDNDGVISAVVKAEPYTEQLTKGRSGGKRPPIAPIEDWVKNKFGISGKQAKSIAFAVATKIGKDGTTWHKKGGSDLVDGVLTSDRIIQIEAAIKAEVIARLNKTIIRKLQVA